MKKPVILALTLGVIFISLTSFEFKKDQRLSTADFRLNGPVKLVYANTFQIAQKNSDELDLPVYSLPKIQEELNEIPDPDTWFMNYGKYSLLYVNFTEKGYLSERTQVFAGMALDRTIYAYDETNKLLWSSSYSMGARANVTRLRNFEKALCSVQCICGLSSWCSTTSKRFASRSHTKR